MIALWWSATGRRPWQDHQNGTWGVQGSPVVTWEPRCHQWHLGSPSAVGESGSAAGALTTRGAQAVTMGDDLGGAEPVGRFDDGSVALGPVEPPNLAGIDTLTSESGKRYMCTETNLWVNVVNEVYSAMACRMLDGTPGPPRCRVAARAC